MLGKNRLATLAGLLSVQTERERTLFLNVGTRRERQHPANLCLIRDE